MPRYVLVKLLLAGLLTAVFFIGTPQIAEATPCSIESLSSCTLRQAADLTGRRIGSTAEASEIGKGVYTHVLSTQFNSLTPENALKWYATQPNQGVWDFTAADSIVDFAIAQNMEIRGHTLVWAQDNRTPGWVVNISDPTQLRQELEIHIGEVMTHFAGRVHRWDVVNEPLASFGTSHSQSVFWNIGNNWITLAFQKAHLMDPTAELWLNEYGTDWVPGKHQAFLELIDQLLSVNTPIDGIGIQTHRLPGQSLDQEIFEDQLRDFTDRGLLVAITELDVPVSPTDAQAFEFQAQEYGKVVAACVAVTGCVEISIWGLEDSSTWLDSLGLFLTPTRPLLYDNNFEPKPAYTKTRQCLAGLCATAALPATGNRSSLPMAVTALALLVSGFVVTSRQHRRNSTN